MCSGTAAASTPGWRAATPPPGSVRNDEGAGMDPILRLTHAYNFAAAKHVDHRRKGEAAEPYMNHLTEAADLPARATGGGGAGVLAAVLHDTVEDTDATFAELAAEFGDKVAGLVAEVTDDKALPKQARK